ncbi:MAG: hypothetical protein ACRC33_14355, partial [Gemmataceae bacterium]
MSAQLDAAHAGNGPPASPPLPVLAAALWLTRGGHSSPAAWLRHATESLPARRLLRGLRPSRSAWYASRDRLPEALLALPHQAVKAALAERLTPGNRSARDGTLVAANSTRHFLPNPPALRPRLVGPDAHGRLPVRRNYSLEYR